MYRKRVVHPLVALTVTAAAFGLGLLCGFVNTPRLMRALWPMITIHSQPAWLSWCLGHLVLLMALARIDIGASLLGSGLTLFLLLKTEPLAVAFRHLQKIGWTIVILTGCLFVFMLSCFAPQIVQVVLTLHGHHVTAGLNALRSLLPIEAIPVLVMFFLVPTSLLFSFVQIQIRLREYRLTREPAGVLQ